ncbi:hypothetical protein [Limnoglobus roseus]|uniref:SMI1/KNR4 family protein n=1 Tax=Limnoglobus roseus TaxID=2598579 RepID=A0A5C1APC7_9BACT|nr:hypothetical protein [Limnoglobus roseus]QEL19064.1 hypothetical protein PX52LOC_06121 [Limnoglobus roseus]
MTDAEWAAATEPKLMLECLRARGAASDRKLRLFAVACCRRIWSALPDEAHRTAVEVAERYADGRETNDERDFWWQESHDACWVIPGDRSDLHHAARAACDTVAEKMEEVLPYFPSVGRFGDLPEEVERKAQADLLRCVFNPFASFDPAWITPTAYALAEAAYEDRAWDRLPILADALEDVGCEDSAVLAHLRGDGPHARGCWVLDLVLGKS